MGLSKERKRAERPALVASPSRGFSLVAALAAYPPLGIARVRAFSSKLTTRQTLSPPENPKQKQKQNSTPQSATSTATSARRSRASSSPECSRRTSARARPGAAATPSWCSWETFSTAGTTRSVRIGEGLSAREKRERERERERERGRERAKKEFEAFPSPNPQREEKPRLSIFAVFRFSSGLLARSPVAALLSWQLLVRPSHQNPVKNLELKKTQTHLSQRRHHAPP